ncbi:acetyl-CoA carboxylase biotin carboxylase subunit [Bifidobacterium animalis]|uniref:acetyl-CoA carboxylase biotin carboxylase subunit n=1 Tax=Bifidobacterium animalis TaxID=28025 RepID=UPI003BFA746A
MFVRLADEAYALGAAETADTYLNIDAMASAAVRAHADAVHPGYGFFAETADFAQAVIDAGLVWVGPKPETIRVLGSKVAARRIAAEVGVPMTPGTTQPVRDAAEVVEFAREHGLPIAIKAVYGGGSRGLKVVHEPDEVAAAFESAMHEAEVAFGNGDCFVERFLARPRHVEVQVLGDQFGTVLAVGTRDCSLQRRNQKLIEEAPAPFLATETVRELERAAVAICSRAHYESAGTVEFLVDDGTMSFMEVNTRIQVEHPVTEAVTGVDLVAAQLAIAEGTPVEAVPGLEPGVTPEPRGHAMEFRINAEDPSLGFVPFPGIVESLQVPTGPGIRFDSGVAAGDSISSRYDSMIAKLIVKAPTRAECLRRAERALAELHIHGVPTVVPFDKAVLESTDFGAGADWRVDDDVSNADFRVYTRWIEEELLPNLPAKTLEDWRRAGERTMGERSGEAASVEKLGGSGRQARHAWIACFVRLDDGLRRRHGARRQPRSGAG